MGPHTFLDPKPGIVYDLLKQYAKVWQPPHTDYSAHCTPLDSPLHTTHWTPLDSVGT